MKVCVLAENSIIEIYTKLIFPLKVPFELSQTFMKLKSQKVSAVNFDSKGVEIDPIHNMV